MAVREGKAKRGEVCSNRSAGRSFLGVVRRDVTQWRTNKGEGKFYHTSEKEGVRVSRRQGEGVRRRCRS